MNIEKVFSELKKDEMNSALGIICSELETQGYKIEIEGIEATSDEIFENKLASLEEVAEPLNVKLFKDGKEDQKFSIDFVEYHEVAFKKYINR